MYIAADEPEMIEECRGERDTLIFAKSRDVNHNEKVQNSYWIGTTHIIEEDKKDPN